MKTLVASTLLVLVLLPFTVLAGVNCFQYAGGVISCDQGSANTTTVPFSNHSGVITHQGRDGSNLTPYTIMPESRSQDLDHAIAPLEPLPSLRSEPPDSRRDRDEPLFLPYLNY